MKIDTRNWGVTQEETRISYPCDSYKQEYSDLYFRGISIAARPETIYRWLCQMRVAPYSYDWIDNLGRQSPRVLTDGLDQLELDQKFMFVFSLKDFELAKHMTLYFSEQRLWRNLFGEVAITYLIQEPVRGEETRLLVKLVVNYPKHPIGLIEKWFLPLGDLIMMRKQLLTFKELSEKQEQGYGQQD